jgi:hypothetical protein
LNRPAQAFDRIHVKSTTSAAILPRNCNPARSCSRNPAEVPQNQQAGMVVYTPGPAQYPVRGLPCKVPCQLMLGLLLHGLNGWQDIAAMRDST